MESNFVKDTHQIVKNNASLVFAIRDSSPILLILNYLLYFVLPCSPPASKIIDISKGSLITPPSQPPHPEKNCFLLIRSEKSKN